MPITVDSVTHVITVPQSYLTPVSAGLFLLDTNQFRLDLGLWASGVDGRSEPFPYDHNTEYTVAGVTYARKVELINGYSWELENTGTYYSVTLSGSNNNLFDVANGIFIPNGNVGLIPNNAAGLQTVSTGSGLSPAESAALSNINSNTSGLTFTKAGELDANIHSVNDVSVNGVGSDADPFGPV